MTVIVDAGTLTEGWETMVWDSNEIIDLADMIEAVEIVRVDDSARVKLTCRRCPGAETYVANNMREALIACTKHQHS